MIRFCVALAALLVTAVGALWWRRTVEADERLICKLHERWVREEPPIPDRGAGQGRFV